MGSIKTNKQTNKQINTVVDKCTLTPVVGSDMEGSVMGNLGVARGKKNYTKKAQCLTQEHKGFNKYLEIFSSSTLLEKMVNHSQLFCSCIILKR